MGQIVQSADGQVQIGEAFRGYLNNLRYRLYVNPIVLDRDTMPAVGVDEPADSGYASVLGAYPNAFADAGDRAEAVGDTLTFVFALDAGAFTVYGLFATDPALSDETIFAVPADTPFTFTAAGQVLIVSMRFCYSDCPLTGP